MRLRSARLSKGESPSSRKGNTLQITVNVRCQEPFPPEPAAGSAWRSANHEKTDVARPCRLVAWRSPYTRRKWDGTAGETGISGADWRMWGRLAVQWVNIGPLTLLRVRQRWKSGILGHVRLYFPQSLARPT